MRSGSVVKKTVISGMLLLLLAALCFAACGEPARDGDSSELDPEFLDGVERADEDGYEVYWLGRGFRAGGWAFDGPLVSPFADVEGGGLKLEYFATVDPATNGAVVLEVTLFSQAAWALAEDRLLNLRAPGVVKTNVVIQGSPGTLLVLPAGTRPVNQAILVWQRDTTTIAAIANAGGALVPGGPDANPLIDPDTLLAVLENLRPYPE